MSKRTLNVLLAGVFTVAASAACDDEPAGITDSTLEPSESVLMNKTLSQVDRTGFPAISTAFVANGDDKDAFNLGEPADDEADFLGVLTTTIMNRYGLDQPSATGLADFVLPDVMPLGDLSGFPNGRAPTDDVIDIELFLIFGAGTPLSSDGVDANDRAFQATFPYLAPPHGA